MKRFLSVLLIILLSFPWTAYAATNAARTKTWTAEKLYASDLNAEFDGLVNYLNNNIAFVTNITASATELNQLDNNNILFSLTHSAAVTDSANHTMRTGFLYTNYGRAVLDSASVDTLYDAGAGGTLLATGMYIVPQTTRNVYLGRGIDRIFRSVHTDTLIGENVTLDSLTVTSGIDSTSIDNGGVAGNDLRNDAVDSTKVRDLGIGRADLATNAVDSTKILKIGAEDVDTTNTGIKWGRANIQTNAIDSTKILKVSYTNLGALSVDSLQVRASAIAGSNLAPTLGTNRFTFPKGLNVADSVVVSAGNVRLGTSNAYFKGASLGLGTTNPDLNGFGSNVTSFALVSPSGDNRASMYMKNTAPGALGSIADIDFFAGANNVARINVIRANDAGSNGGFMRFGTATGGSLNYGVVIDSARNVGIGTSIKLGAQFDVNNGASYSRVNAGDAAWTASSDSTLKKSMVNLNPTALDILGLFRNIPVINYQWKGSVNQDSITIHVGMRAQEFYSISQALKSKASNKEINTQDVMMSALLMIKQLDARALAQEATIDSLRKRLLP